MSKYLDFDCKNCGRHRVEINGMCEKCNFDNIHNEFAQPILECLEHGAGTCRNENLIEELRAELARRDEELKITDGLLKEATETIGAVVACCTYNSNEDAKIGVYGISPDAFTRIDRFITRYNRAVSAGKVSVDVKTSTDNNKGE